MRAESAKARYLNEPDADTPEKTLLRKELKQIIEAKLSRLESEEQAVLEMHYGLRGRSEMTLEEIASSGGLGLTKGQVAHVERRARKKIARMSPEFRSDRKPEILGLLDS